MGHMKCLELGAGTGATTKSVLPVAGGLTVTAVESDPDMRTILNAKLGEWDAKGRVTVVPADILEHLQSLSANSFHFIVSAFTLHNIEWTRRDQIIQEIFRVLERGGTFVNADKYARDLAVEQETAYKRQIADFEIFEVDAKTGDLPKWVAHYERDEQPDLIFHETPAKEFMRKVGFERVLTAYRENMEAVIVGRKP